MADGYQVIEPSSIGKFISNSTHASFAVAILGWAIEKLKSEEASLIEGLRIQVIAVSYMGTYPAVGVHYGNPTAKDRGIDIETAINRIVIEGSISEFLEFAVSSFESWEDVWVKIKAE